MARLSRRTLIGVALLFTLALVAAACGGGDDPSAGGDDGASAAPGEPSGTLRLFSYADGFEPEYIGPFEEEYPEVQLESKSFGSGDEAIAQLQAGFEADVVNSCVEEATAQMVDLGMYQPLDVSRLEHWDEIWPAMKEMPGVQKDGQVYLVPVDAGTAGIMYDADEITTPPDSWLDLFDPQYQGRAALEDLSVTAIDVAALANGIENPLEMTPEQLEETKQFLIDHKDNFRTFWKGEAAVKSLFKNGEIVIASGYPGTAKQLRKDGVNVQFAAAKEGQMLWTCGYGISSEANPDAIDAAYALLNYYTSLPPQIYAATNWNYLTSNQGIIDAVPPEVVEEASLDSLYDLENALPASPPDDPSAWRAAWTEVKAG
ncbi:MAG: extracellular solute-binding protein [Actinomycetota bacterium]